ncbi:MAG: NAD(P)-binding protein [Gammaproteobacteria bacterium]
MAASSEDMKQETKITWRRYHDGETEYDDLTEKIFQAGWSHKCPTYIQRTPPCQASCPSGHDIRGWLDIVRGLEKPPEGVSWQEYAFQRYTEANPFPSVMGRVCPAPCEDGCNRNEVEDKVGINAVEQFIGDYAFSQKLTFPKPEKESGKRVAIIGGGPAGLACAHQLRMKGHGCTIFESAAELGGMIRYGIPGYRTPRDVLDHEIQRILDMGVDVRTNCKVGVDISVEELEKEYDAIFWAIGAQSGRALDVPGGDAPNCITGVAFLNAFNDGRLKHVSGRVVVVGGGDTSIDVASVARRLGHIKNVHEKDRPESAILGQVAHDVASTAKREGAEVLLISRRPIESMHAAKKEIEDALREGVEIRGGVNPSEIIIGEDGRACGLKLISCEEKPDGSVVCYPGTEVEIEADLIVSAIGQQGDFEGIEQFNNGRGLMDSDKHFQVPNHPGHFVAGDIIRPHLLTTAIGQARIAANSIDDYLNGREMAKRPKIDANHFSLLRKLHEMGRDPEEIHEPVRGTSEAKFAIHNFDSRAANEVIPADELFLGHFGYEPRIKRKEREVTADEVLGNFEERIIGLTEEEAIAEAKRCMSCGMCVECDNCIIYCPQDAVFRVKKSERTLGRYVDTDYTKCIGCHICRDVCPTGYIQMGLGE